MEEEVEGMAWFRWENTSRHNRKLRALPVEGRWLYVTLCEIASQLALKGVVHVVPGVKYTDDQFADEAKVPLECVRTCLEQMKTLQLIEEGDECLYVTAFAERQYQSDSSVERTKTYRDRKKQRGDGDVTARDGHCDGVVTPPDTDTDNTSSQLPFEGETSFTEETTEYRLACLLRSRILANLPNAKVPRDAPAAMAKWSLAVDRMIRIDKRDHADIEWIITWCQNDDFWQSNILSTDKLRKQFDVLMLRSGRNTRTRPPAARPAPVEDDVARRLRELGV